MAFDPAQSYLQGAAIGRENRLASLVNDISKKMGDSMFDPASSMEFGQLAALDPKRASLIRSNFEKLSEDRKRKYFEYARDSLDTLENKGLEDFLELSSKRLDYVESVNGDTSGIKMLINKALQGDFAELSSGLMRTVEAGIASGFLPKPGGKPQDLSVGATVYGRDETGNPRVGNVVFDKSNKKSWVEWADGGTTSIDKPSDAQKSAIRIAEAEKKAEIEGRAASEKLLTEERNKIRLDIYKTGRNAKKGINDLDRMQRAIDAFGTGKMEQFKLLAGPYIPGIDPTDPQAMQALLNKGVFPVLAGFSGAISEGERSFAEKTVANLGNTPEANKIIISHMKRALQDEIDKLDQFKSWEKEGNKEHESFQFTPVDFSERSEADILKEYGL